jgi:hypothetical protein
MDARLAGHAIVHVVLFNTSYPGHAYLVLRMRVPMRMHAAWMGRIA